MSSAHWQIAVQRSGRRSLAARRRSVPLAAALLAILVATCLVLPLPRLGGVSIAVAAIERAKSFVQLMHQRSPGKRLVGHLVKMKHRKLALHQRALPKVRRRPPQVAAMPPFPAELPPAFVDLVSPPVPVQMASLEAIPIAPLAEQPLWPFPPSGPPGGYILPPGGSPLKPVPPIGPPREAVPEPATWAMMLFGFALIGWTLRTTAGREQIAA